MLDPLGWHLDPIWMDSRPPEDPIRLDLDPKFWSAAICGDFD